MFSSALNMLLSRFPEYEETIKLLYHFDDDFKSLCDDYHLSHLNADKFRNKITQDKQNELEYKNLSEDLEREIIIYVKDRH
jgi:hypothetical protein